MAHQAGTYFQFLWHEVTRSISTPPYMGCQSIAGLPPALNFPVPVYTPGWSEALWEWSILPKNRTQCLRPGHKLGLLDPEKSALTMRPPCLPSSSLPETSLMSLAGGGGGSGVTGFHSQAKLIELATSLEEKLSSRRPNQCSRSDKILPLQTIRLWAQDFCCKIVEEGATQVNHHE